MSLPLAQEIHHDERSRGEETTNLPGTGPREVTSHGRDGKQDQTHSEEAVESLHEVSTSTSRDEDEVASSIEDSALQDVESSISEPAYTVFTASQKRFIALLAACAGFFSAVSPYVECNRNPSLTLLGFGKHLLSGSQFAD
jgi:hypothetical protein